MLAIAHGSEEDVKVASSPATLIYCRILLSPSFPDLALASYDLRRRRRRSIPSLLFEFSLYKYNSQRTSLETIKECGSDLKQAGSFQLDMRLGLRSLRACSGWFGLQQGPKIATSHNT